MAQFRLLCSDCWVDWDGSSLVEFPVLFILVFPLLHFWGSVLLNETASSEVEFKLRSMGPSVVTLLSESCAQKSLCRLVRRRRECTCPHHRASEAQWQERATRCSVGTPIAAVMLWREEALSPSPVARGSFPFLLPCKWRSPEKGFLSGQQQP